MKFKTYNLDCRDVMDMYLADNSVDSIVTDPPYGLGFMGKEWDHGVPGTEFWERALRVLKPGGHLLAFSGSRTYHRMVCAIEDAGFEIRDQIMWVYGSGFPKSLDVSKAIDKAAGVEREVVGVAGKSGSARSCMAGDFAGGEYMTTAANTDAARQWQGWGTALKPAFEPICVARKPLIGTVATNVLTHGTGALNIDGCRVESGGEHMVKGTVTKQTTVTGDERTGAALGMYGAGASFTPTNHEGGRWPANLIHDGSAEVTAQFPDSKGQMGATGTRTQGALYGAVDGGTPDIQPRGDSGSAARFFYCAKASAKDRNDGLDDPGPQFKHGATLRKIENTQTKGNTHPTVKPTDLMAYLCRLVTPPGGIVLDPFMGSGSTGKAAVREGFRFIGCELETEYHLIADARLKAAL